MGKIVKPDVDTLYNGIEKVKNNIIKRSGKYSKDSYIVHLYVGNELKETNVVIEGEENTQHVIRIKFYMKDNKYEFYVQCIYDNSNKSKEKGFIGRYKGKFEKNYIDVKWCYIYTDKWCDYWWNLNTDTNNEEIANMIAVTTKKYNFQELELGSFGLNELPEKVKDLSEIRSINLNFNKLNIFPKKILSFYKLEYISIISNKLVNIDEDIYKLKFLKEIDLMHNYIKKIPDGLYLLRNLEKIFLSNNTIYTLSNEIRNLKYLKELYIDGNDLSEIPDGLFELENLEFLNLSNNKLKCIPKDIRKLKKLKYLDISNNCYKEIPEELSQLENLECLEVRHLTAEEIPDVLIEKEKNGLEISKIEYCNNYNLDIDDELPF